MSPQEHQNKAPLLAKQGQEKIDVDLPSTLINRELSWLSFARRVLALAENPNLPLLERVKFAGIMGMLYDEFAMKRMGGLKRKIEKRKHKKNKKLSPRLASFLVW
jgi:polyphosphate kinase